MKVGSTPRRAFDIDDLAAEVIERTIRVSSVPAPTGEEHERAALVADWWAADGFGAVSIDKAGNCWATVRNGTGPAVVLAAHLDTVFGTETEHVVKRSGDRLFGPGVGDNGVAVAALAAVGRLLGRAQGKSPVLILATVGEEGLGNLAGARHAVAYPPAELGALIAVEGNYLGKIGTTGVGSRRWRVLVTGPGGHAWEQSGAPSAVHEAARIVEALSGIPTVAGASSLNVGTARGRRVDQRPRTKGAVRPRSAGSRRGHAGIARVRPPAACWTSRVPSTSASSSPRSVAAPAAASNRTTLS